MVFVTFAFSEMECIRAVCRFSLHKMCAMVDRTTVKLRNIRELQVPKSSGKRNTERRTVWNWKAFKLEFGVYDLRYTSTHTYRI